MEIVKKLLSGWDAIKEYISILGTVRGVSIIFFFAAHYYVRRLYNKNIAFKQAEIDRMAEFFKEYRMENKELRNELRDCYKKRLGKKDKS